MPTIPTTSPQPVAPPLGLAIVLGIGLLVTGPVWAGPFVITQDSVIEGSLRHGGIQPDYLVRLDDPGLRPLLRRAEKIGRQAGLTYWDRVERVRQLVSEALPRGRYDEPRYQDLISRHRKEGTLVPLGAYPRQKAGVCREHYLILHLALTRAGIDNQAVYARVQQGTGGSSVVEDHGLVVLKGGPGDGWTVDSYNNNFNSVRYEDLLRARGVGSSARLSPIGRGVQTTRRIISLNPYPLVKSAPPRPPHDGFLVRLKRQFQSKMAGRVETAPPATAPPNGRQRWLRPGWWLRGFRKVLQNTGSRRPARVWNNRTPLPPR